MAIAVTGACLIVPSVASAADTFVNQVTGDDADNCLQATPGVMGVGPCKTIGQAITNAGATDTIHVAAPLSPTTYSENISLGTKKLVASDPDNTKTIISGGAASAAVTVGSGRVQGFTIVGTFGAMQVNGSATIIGNRFDQDTVGTGQFAASISVGAGASPTITGNVFDDDVPDANLGIFAPSNGSPLIGDNSFDGFANGIFVSSGVGGATPVITANDFSGVHATMTTGIGIQVFTGAIPTITANHFHDPGTGTTRAIDLFQNSPSPAAGAALHRNRITGAFNVGVGVQGTTGTVSLEGDLIAGAVGAGLFISDNMGNPGSGDASATNVTVFDTSSASDVIVNGGFGATTLTLNSSIIGATPDDTITPGIQRNAMGACVISFSRGDGPNASGCNTGFVSAADPMFASPGSPDFDYHLKAGSPMIDAGDPADPMGALDTDGDLFGLSSVPACTTSAGRRDIGADEFVPPTGVGCPVQLPATAAIAATPATATTKKCKKGRKLKKGKCVRKKKKR